MKTMLKITSFFLLFILHSCSAPAQEEGAQTMPVIVEVENAQELMSQEGLVVLDVRTPREVGQGFINGSQNLDIAQWEAFKSGVDELDKSAPVLVYCAVGGRSQKAAAYLVDNGFTTVYDLKGGIISWEKAGKPLKKD